MPQIGCDDLNTGTLGALNDTVVIASPSSSTVNAQITGTFSGTITWEGNTDRPGNNWVTIPAARTNGSGTVATTAVLAGAPNNIDYVLSMAAFKRIRARCSAYTSGTATVHFNASVAPANEGLLGIGGGGGGGGGAVTVADGADTAQGTTTDAGVTTDTSGTVIGFLRGAIVQGISFLARIPAALTGSGNFKVSLAESTATQAVSGTVTATANQNGTWTVQPGNTANTTAWKVDGSAVTQPVSAASLPLPTNAATDRATAGAPGSVELSDGSAFYTAAKTGQLPTALVSSRLDVNLGAAPASLTVGTLPAIPTGANTIGAVTQASGPWTANGPGANQAAVSGNPNWIAGSTTAAGGNLQGLVVESAAQPNLRVALFNAGSEAIVATPNTDAVGQSSTPALAAESYGYAFDGVNWNRNRNNNDVALLASASRTTTQGPTTLTTYNLGAIIFVLDMTTVGTGSVTLTINEVDPASGKSILLLSGAAVATNSTNVYTIDPMLTAAANSIAKNRITRTLSWQVTANNANPATYSLGAMEQVS